MQEEIVKNIKKEKIKLLILIASLLVLVSSVTYAFFAAGIGDSAQTGIDVSADVSESLEFFPGTPVNLNANQTNFDEGMGSLSGETSSQATLIASASIGSATQNYYVYFNISNNEYIYTVDENTPELLLTITDPTGAIVTSIAGLNYKTVIDASTGTELSGFDVTTYEGLITVDDAYEITTTDSESGFTQEWKAKVTFVNLATSQRENGGKKFESEIILTKDELTLGAICKDQEIASCITSNISLAHGLIQHTPELANSAGDNNYRYSGSNTLVDENWVCFGSDEAACPAENKYRIIGIYDGSVKIIKATAIDKDGDGILEISYNGEDTFIIDDSNSNNYGTSDIRVYLNGEYYNKISSNYQTMIKESIWNVGGNNTWDETAYEFYRDNIGSPVINKTSNGKIGLMYASDYGFAAHTEAWTTDLVSYDNQTIKDNNWLFTSRIEWTITPITTDLNRMLLVSSQGVLSAANVRDGYASRPVLYLESSAKILSGTGSETDPFHIGM